MGRRKSATLWWRRCSRPPGIHTSESPAAGRHELSRWGCDSPTLAILTPIPSPARSLAGEPGLGGGRRAQADPRLAKEASAVPGGDQRSWPARFSRSATIPRPSRLYPLIRGVPTACVADHSVSTLLDSERRSRLASVRTASPPNRIHGTPDVAAVHSRTA